MQQQILSIRVIRIGTSANSTPKEIRTCQKRPKCKMNRNRDHRDHQMCTMHMYAHSIENSTNTVIAGRARYGACDEVQDVA